MTKRHAKLRLWGAAALAVALVGACGSAGESPGESNGEGGFPFDIIQDSSPGEGGGDDIVDDTDAEEDVQEDVELDPETDTTDIEEEVTEDVADVPDTPDVPDVPDTMDVEEDIDMGFPDVDIEIPEPSEYEIALLGSNALPELLTIDEGDSVRFINRDINTVAISATDGSWETGDIMGGMFVDLVFDEGGTFTYGPASARAPWGTLIVRSTSLVGDALVELDVVTGEGLTYTPSMIQIDQGDTVVWANQTSDRTLSIESDVGLFASGDLRPGFRFAYTFDEAGFYAYLDTATRTRVGTIEVVGPEPEPDYTVLITDVFEPAELTVTRGEVVQWVNNDDQPHSVVALLLSAGLDSGLLEPGESFFWVAATEGVFEYADAATRGGARGTLTVVAP